MNIQETLQNVHEIEQREDRMIGRKELHTHIPADATYEEKRALIQAWQSTYFQRLANVSRNRLVASLVNIRQPSS